MRGLGRLKLSSIALIDYVSSANLRNKLLINGFWRSGTTWLQQTLVDALNAKSLFEPFSPAAGHKWDQLSHTVSEASRNVYMPLSANCLTPRDRMTLYLALKGVGTHGYTHFLRSAHSPVWSKSLMVKSTQLGFVLDEIARNRTLPIIHIRRHPAAVYASFKETDWSWSIQDVRLDQNYSLQDFTKGTVEYERAETLLRFDQSPAHRMAALWSLSERAAQQSIRSNRAQFVSYEDIVSEGAAILNRLQISSVNIQSNVTASPVTNIGRESLTVKERLNDWTSRLTPFEIDCIRSVCQELFPDNGYFQNSAHPIGERRFRTG